MHGARPGKLVRQHGSRQWAGIQELPRQGKLMRGFIGRPEAQVLFHRDDGVKTLAAAGSLWLPG